MRLLVTLAVSALLALAVSACGSGAKSANTESQGNSPSTTAASVSPATTGSTSSSAATNTTTAPAQANTGTQTAPSSGSSSKGTSSKSGSSQAQRYPRGDNSIQTFGKQATSAEVQAVSSAVTRYYAALASGDGAGACALLSARLSKSLVQGLGRSAVLRNKGCPGIISLLFKHRSGQSNASLKGVEVTSVRVSGDRGFALLHSKSNPAGEISVARENGEWKIGALIGGSLP